MRYILYTWLYFNFNWELFFCTTRLRRGGLNTPPTAVQLFFPKVNIKSSLFVNKIVTKENWPNRKWAHFYWCWTVRKDFQELEAAVEQVNIEFQENQIQSMKMLILVIYTNLYSRISTASNYIWQCICILLLFWQREK